jgi:flagellar biosynthesis/type III secretory pathway M-ring protein FliF/YscJ
MLKGFMWIILFVFFVIVFFVLLAWGMIVKTIKNMRKAAQNAADLREQRMRDEVGRQRQQYSQRQQTQNTQRTQNAQRTEDSQRTQESQQDNARRTQTATGETIIDHHHEKRENQKIFDDSDGEYVEFEEA